MTTHPVKRQRQLQKEARKQRIQDRSVIDHVARGLGATAPGCPTVTHDAYLYGQIMKEWAPGNGGPVGF